MASILIVDDDADIRELLVYKLKHAGFEVHAEADGETGLAAARELHPDVVVLDWMMPRMTGPEVCRAIRSDASLAGVPVIMLTAKAQEPDVERGFAVGADDFVVKPFSARELMSRIRVQLSRTA
jgi:DNA-binding response OmpR family regulator